MQVDIYFTFYLVSADQKTIFASTFLRGRAQHWLKPNLRKYLEDHDENPRAMFTNFDNFKRELRRIFGTFNEKQIAKTNREKGDLALNLTNLCSRLRS